MDGITPEAWLNLGIPGAALFIVLVIVISMFKQQSKSVDKLCIKIDELVTSFSDNNLKLNEVIIQMIRTRKRSSENLMTSMMLCRICTSELLESILDSTTINV